MSEWWRLTWAQPTISETGRSAIQMLQVEGLEAGYDKVAVLRGLSFGVPRGQVVALIGANGAGKTTALRTLSGLLAPWSGRVSLAGRDITALPAHQVARAGLAHCPEGRRVFPQHTVRANLRLGAYTRSGIWSERAQRKAVAEDMERILALFPRLREREGQLAGTLSGGEQQMLAMGRALMLQPQVLLLDEPSLGLAPLLVDEVFRIIRTLKEQGTTLLLVEQFAHAALAVADYGYVLEQGVLVHQGPAAQLRSDPKVRAAYLGG